MKIITINLPERTLDAIQQLLDHDHELYPSRSEIIRQSIDKFLRKEFAYFDDIKPDTLNKLLKGVKN